MKRIALAPAIVISVGLSVVAVIALGFTPGLNLSGSGQAQEEKPLLTYPTFPPTPTISTAPSQPTQLVAAALFSADFTPPSGLDGWKFVDGERVLPGTEAVWTIKDGRLVQDRTAAAHSPSMQETLALVGMPTWANYTISAKVYDQANGTFGLVARYQDKHFYRYSIIADRFEATPKQLLEKVVDGVSMPLAAVDAPGYQPDRWYIVSMQVADTMIKVWLNGVLVAEATDTTLTSGATGLYTRAMGDIFFDDIVVQ